MSIEPAPDHPLMPLVALAIVQELGCAPALVTAGALLQDGALVCDTLDLAAIAVTLEQRLDIDIADEDLDTCTTVGDLAALCGRLRAAARERVA
jgi:acyl carrier protein